TGSINFDNIIGNPGDLYNDEYGGLSSLNKDYFQTWLNNKSYNYYDYIRLLKFFDGSLFKIIKDFTPARSNTITGLTIQPHVLERNKIKQYKPTLEINIYSSSIDKIGKIEDDKSYIWSKLNDKKA